jgi:hypothetical protein
LSKYSIDEKVVFFCRKKSIDFAEKGEEERSRIGRRKWGNRSKRREVIKFKP